MKLLALLIGLVLILEGIPYVAAPDMMKNWLQKLCEIAPAQLRLVGLISMGLGLFICYLVQRTALFP